MKTFLSVFYLFAKGILGVALLVRACIASDNGFVYLMLGILFLDATYQATRFWALGERLAQRALPKPQEN